MQLGISEEAMLALGPEPVWDCNQAARFLGLHPKTVKRMARAGEIPGCRLGRRWIFRPSELDALLRAGVSSSNKDNSRRNHERS
jgi:excisionase family DNA binding protein